MRITIIILFALIMSSACKTEASNQSTEDNTDINQGAVEHTTSESNTTEDGTDSTTHSEGVQTTENEVQEQTKSVPKKEVQPQKDVIEAVATDDSGNTSTMPPRPEPESKSGHIEQVDVKEKVKDKIMKEKARAQVSHDDFNDLLKKYVSDDGRVNYKDMKKDMSDLDSYLKTLEKTAVGSLSRNEQLAFWINAYNAYTIKLILNNYPVQSITQLHDGKPWDVKWIKLNGQNLSLNNIENDIIRPQFKDPRIHFAVNCAAKSCPPLLNKAYTGTNVENLLDKQTKKFILNKKFNQVDGNPIKISKIFKWYKEDFGNVIDYFNYYGNLAIDNVASVFYNGYDWRLNE